MGWTLLLLLWLHISGIFAGVTCVHAGGIDWDINYHVKQTI